MALELAPRKAKHLGDAFEHSGERAVIGALNMALGLHRHPKVLLAGTAFASGFAVPAALTGPTLAALVASPLVWAAVHRDSFERHCIEGAGAMWRREWGYKRRWDVRMKACKLNVGDDVPVLKGVTQEAWGERVLIELPWGLEHDDLRGKAGKVALAFDKPLCRVKEHRGKARRAWLEFSDGRALHDTIPVPPFHDTNLAAVHLGRREDGKPWLYQVRHPERGYTHLFVAGMTGAGKSSLFWQGFRELAPMVRDGRLELWVADPKFGVEFGPGQALFAEYADDDASIAAMLSRAVTRMQANGAAMKEQGISQHEPTRALPAICIAVDEIVSLLNDCEDKKLRESMERDLRLILRMGRVLGVFVWSATQDPSVESFPLRKFFSTAIGLRMARANQPDMVFGKGARDDGATCDKIPEDMPGAGFEITEQGITMVRSAHVTREARDELLELYGRDTWEVDP